MVIYLKPKVYLCVQHVHPDSSAILYRTLQHLSNVSLNQFAKQAQNVSRFAQQALTTTQVKSIVKNAMQVATVVQA
jgi:hypothetical protein